MTPEKCAQAKAQAMAGYLDPGPNHLNCAQAVLTSALLATDDDPGLTNWPTTSAAAWRGWARPAAPSPGRA